MVALEKLRSKIQNEQDMSGQEIKIEYLYTEPEYLAATRLYFLSSPAIVGRLAVLFALIMAVSLILTFLIDFPLWTTILVTLVVEAFLLYAVVLEGPRKYFRGDGKFRDKYEVTFSDDGIAVKTKNIDSKLSWSLYTRVVEGAGMYLLIYGKETRMMTMVPKRAFQNRLQEDAFRELLARHIRDHTTMRRLKPGNESEPEYTPSSLDPPDWR